MADNVKPILLDETGQAIKEALVGIKAALEKPSETYEQGFTAGQEAGYAEGHQTGYAEGQTEGYATGEEAGRSAEKAICQAQHYTASVMGSGTGVMTVPIPFAPDTLMVYSTSPYTEAQGLVVRAYSMDRRSCANRTAVVIYTTAAHSNGANLSTMEIDTLAAYADGVLTLESGVAANPIWSADVRYTVTAAKYPDETEKGLIEEQIALLPDAVPGGNSGTMQYKAARINALFTDTEWAALIATKPNWTFSLV